MRHVTRTRVVGHSNKVRHKPICAVKEEAYNPDIPYSEEKSDFLTANRNQKCLRFVIILMYRSILKADYIAQKKFCLEKV